MNTLLNGQTFVDSSKVGCWSHLTFLLIVVEQSVRHFGDGEEGRHLPGGGGVAGGGQGVQRQQGGQRVGGGGGGGAGQRQGQRVGQPGSRGRGRVLAEGGGGVLDGDGGRGGGVRPQQGGLAQTEGGGGHGVEGEGGVDAHARLRLNDGRLDHSTHLQQPGSVGRGHGRGVI